MFQGDTIENLMALTSHIKPKKDTLPKALKDAGYIQRQYVEGEDIVTEWIPPADYLKHE